MRNQLSAAARVIVPAIWLGLIIAIDMIEAPLKFQAPGITIPLGLGIGRLVFSAMNLVEGVLAIVVLVALWSSRADRRTWILGAVISALFAVKVAVIRPVLNHETDAVLAGLSAGGSVTHLIYIGTDALLAITLAWFLARQVRILIRPHTAPKPGPSDVS